MRLIKLLLISFCSFFVGSIFAQEYTFIIKGGHVIDPKNNINEVMDVAVLDKKVVAVAKNIDAKKAAQVIDAKGMYVTPGVIDIHSHNFFLEQSLIIISAMDLRRFRRMVLLFGPG